MWSLSSMLLPLGLRPTATQPPRSPDPLNPPMPTPLQGKGKWVPPEAAAVAARLAEQNSSWQCGACTLVNAPAARVCEACGQLRPSPEDAHNQWKQQGAADPAAAAAAQRAPAPVAAAVAPAAPSGGGWAAAARPAPAAAPAAAPTAAAVVAPAAPPVSSADAFPSLPSAAPSRGGGAASSSSAGGGGGAAGGGKKKGKKSLQEFVKETKVHPQVCVCCTGFWCGWQGCAARCVVWWAVVLRCISGAAAFHSGGRCSRVRPRQGGAAQPPLVGCPPSLLQMTPLLCPPSFSACHCPHTFCLALTPQNVWRNPSLRGQWAQGGGGKLAQEERALLDAYGSKQK